MKLSTAEIHVIQLALEERVKSLTESAYKHQENSLARKLLFDAAETALKLNNKFTRHVKGEEDESDTISS